MTYEQTVDYLFNRLPNYQKQGKSAYKADLSNITSLCNILVNPQDKIKTIHVAGTNGKGSTCHMLASIFQEAGYKVGLFTSPHLLDFRERVKINGEMIPKENVISFVDEYQLKFELIEPSFFEWTTSLAFYHFAQQKVDVAIIETGLGGRLDSTNIINPELSIITNISLDHANILGDTLEQIAVEKAGIIKSHIPVIVGEQSEKIKAIFTTIAKKKDSKVHFSLTQNNYTTDLKGEYQNQNISTILKAIGVLKSAWNISNENIEAGLNRVIANTNLRGRWEILSEHPKTICDVGHNEAGIKSIIEQIQKEQFDKLHVVWGMANDKEIIKILTLLPMDAHYYFCAADSNRSLDTETLQKEALNVGLYGNSYPSVKKALDAANKMANTKDFIFIGGSTFTVAEVLI